MKKWFKYVKPYMSAFILGPLCMVVEVIGEILMPRFLGEIINYTTADPADGTWHSLLMAFLMVLVALLMMAGGVGGAYFGAKASVNFAADLRNDIYKKVQSFSFANIDRFSSSSLITRLTNDVTQLQNMVNMMLRMCLRAPGMMIGGIIMAIALRPSLATVLAVTIPLMVLAVAGIIAVGFPRFARMQTAIDTLNGTVQENITNVRVVKSFVREEHEKEKFAASNAGLKKAGIDAAKVVIFMSPVTTLCMNLTTVAVIWFGSRIIYTGAGTADAMPVGDLSSFVMYVTQILSSLMMVTFILMGLSRALASAKRIREVLDEKTDISDETAAFPSATVQSGSVEFRHVSFRYYKNSEEKVLDDISFTVNPGETVGIIGSTGCGKTTLVSMIPRLYDADEGDILVDGISVRDYSLYNLREGVGMVLQKNVLFSGSIEDNLRWGNADASDEDIRTAAEYAQANKFIENFQNGYAYDLGQGGTNVSGGQKQRLCIARALLKKPKILILDDSTSAVDTATEAAIRRAFREELSGSTKIIIAQRISSVMEADKIVVMDDGKITGIGTHAELLENNEAYSEIYRSQTDGKAGV